MMCPTGASATQPFEEYSDIAPIPFSTAAGLAAAKGLPGRVVPSGWLWRARFEAIRRPGFGRNRARAPADNVRPRSPNRGWR